MTPLYAALLSLVVGVLAFVVGRLSCAWSHAEPEPPQAVAVEDGPLLARARVLTAEAEVGAGSGEYKRHAVYARLIKEFPGESRRAIARAIEDGLPS